MTPLQFTAIAVVFQLLTAVLLYQYTVHQQEGTCSAKVLFSLKIDFAPLMVVLVGFFASVYVFLKGHLMGDDGFIRALMNAEVMLWLSCIGFIDYRDKIIPNKMIVAGLIFWLVLLLLDIFVAGNDWLDVFMFSLLGGLFCGGVLLVIALIVKTALGMGDVKMFFVLGLLYGVTDTYSILLFSMVVMAAVSIVLLLLKKVTTKTAVPMAPFVAVGFLLSIFAGM